MSADDIGSAVDIVEVVMATSDVDLMALGPGGPAAAITCVAGGTVVLVASATPAGTTRTLHNLPAGKRIEVQACKIVHVGTTETSFWVEYR